ncbi:hypothetical protein QG37_06015 [Candidozyma auris]|nr:hypothetical protein QG37_06015 [[Candida] auris]
MFRQKEDKKNAQARNRTGGPTMATLDFTTKPLARLDVGKARDLGYKLAKLKGIFCYFLTTHKFSKQSHVNGL